VIAKGFKKCCISSTVDRTDMLWNDSEEDGDVRRRYEEDEGSDCEDEDSDTDWYRLVESDSPWVLSV
jgi:hypothetical protein